MSELDVTRNLILRIDDCLRRIGRLETQEISPYKGTKAADFAVADLPQHGDYGYQTTDSEVQMNCNGVIRAITTAAL